MKKIEFLRRKQNLTQDQLGDKLLYTRHTLSRLEAGKLGADEVSPRLRRAVESYFHEPIEQLLADV
ncbi:MAG: helix-turn-helix transcriptional regulator [Thermodesulfobacteriota bacterium]